MQESAANKTLFVANLGPNSLSFISRHNSFSRFQLLSAKCNKSISTVLIKYTILRNKMRIRARLFEAH